MRAHGFPRCSVLLLCLRLIPIVLAFVAITILPLFSVVLPLLAVAILSFLSVVLHLFVAVLLIALHVYAVTIFIVVARSLITLAIIFYHFSWGSVMLRWRNVLALLRIVELVDRSLRIKQSFYQLHMKQRTVDHRCDKVSETAQKFDQVP